MTLGSNARNRVRNTTVSVRFCSAQTDLPVVTGRRRKNHGFTTISARGCGVSTSLQTSPLTRQTRCVCARAVCAVESITNNGYDPSSGNEQKHKKKNDDDDDDDV